MSPDDVEVQAEGVDAAFMTPVSAVCPRTGVINAVLLPYAINHIGPPEETNALTDPLEKNESVYIVGQINGQIIRE